MKPKLSKHDQNQLAVVVIESIDCHSCAYKHEDAKIVLESMRAKDDGWKALGSVKCPNCGMALTSVKKKIPILAGDFKCPTCNKKGKLAYKITKIKQADESTPEEFEFQADIVCGKLSHKFSLKKIIKSVLGIMSIGVGPEGVKLSKSE